MRMLALRKGMTLTEIMVVIIILAIFSSISFPKYERAMESAIGKEARVSLELIYAAEQVIYAQSGSYVDCDDINNGFGDCNVNLNINLKPGNWLYEVVSAAGVPPTFIITATRNGGSGAYNNKTINLQSDGTWSGTWPIPY